MKKTILRLKKIQKLKAPPRGRVAPIEIPRGKDFEGATNLWLTAQYSGIQA